MRIEAAVQAVPFPSLVEVPGYHVIVKIIYCWARQEITCTAFASDKLQRYDQGRRDESTPHIKPVLCSPGPNLERIWFRSQCQNC